MQPRLLPLIGAVTLCVPASAQNLNVAIVAAATTSSTDCRFTGPQAHLLATGLFATVDIINATTSTPTLQQLQQYDAILTWSNNAYQDSTALGNVLADYVDAGGGVVVAVFANAIAGAGSRLQGRWVPNYEVVVGGSGQTQGGGPFFLGNVLAPGHPLMAGVTSFAGGTSSYRPTTTVLTPGSTSIAEWSDGRILVATGAQPNRVDLGFYPPDSICRADFWDVNTDGDRLLANALAFAGSGGSLGAPYCSPANVNTSGLAGRIDANGSNIALDNNVTLVASNVPPNQFGFFLTSQTQGLVMNPGGSQGNLCLGGTIGRYVRPGQVKNAGAMGTFSLMLPLPQTPAGSVFVPILGGQTWNFQAWFRDIGPMGQPWSNFTDARAITFN